MRFIIINGTTGSGKSTLAKLLQEKYELSYRLDVDEVRHNVQGFKENRETSRKLSFAIASSIVRTCLSNNMDVVLDKMMYSNHDTFDGTFALENFISLGKKYSAEMYEIILHCNKETALGRLNDRGYPEFDLNTPQKAERHWEKMNAFKNERPQGHLIDTSNLTPKQVFKAASKILDRI